APMMYSGGTVTPAAADTGGGVAVRALVCPAGAVGRAGCACGAHGIDVKAMASAASVPAIALAILFERNLTVMFSEEVQEPFVVARVHVEDARDDLVVAAGFLQAFPDDFAHIRARDFALHE